jgi:hypothetical protein
MPDNVVIIPATREPQCPYLISDGISGRRDHYWHCQEDEGHEGEHRLPQSNNGGVIGMGEWLHPNTRLSLQGSMLDLYKQAGQA